MKTSYFSFGLNHCHRVPSVPYDFLLTKDTILKITSKDPRQSMIDRFGREWSFEYSLDTIEMSYFPVGIVNMDNKGEFFGWEHNWDIREFYNADVFASLILDRVIDLGYEINEKYLEFDPGLENFIGENIHFILEKHRPKFPTPAFERYETTRAYLYDLYEHLKTSSNIEISPSNEQTSSC